MNNKPRMQYGALPYRFVDGSLEILLVTSRETGRWIIPKGWGEKSVKPHAMAQREAFEEAGVRGKISKRSFGSYRYEKRLTPVKSVECEVRVFPLQVEEELDEWPEKGQRERCWLKPSQAAMTISDSGLVSMLLRLGLPG
jgi:8-oxo-dGTP pyrophosphatase MutT (NUDIX family)